MEMGVSQADGMEKCMPSLKHAPPCTQQSRMTLSIWLNQLSIHIPLSLLALEHLISINVHINTVQYCFTAHYDVVIGL